MEQLKDDKKPIIDILSSKEIKIFLDKFNILTLLTFGSFNTHDFNIESDVDIAVIGEKKIPLNSILEIELFLERKLKREIDVIDIRDSALNLFLKIDVLNNGITLYTIDNNKILNSYKSEIDKIYKENENFFWFRRKDVLS